MKKSHLWIFLAATPLLALIWLEFLTSNRSQPNIEPPHDPPHPTSLALNPQPLPHEVTLDTLLRDLASPAEPQRRAAQVFLAHTPPNQRAWLRRHAAESNDPDIKAALLQRADDLEELLATNPPPISLHVKEASLQDVIIALNQELGTDLKYESFGQGPPGTYTLDATDQPLWQVIADLDKQRPFWLRPLNGVLSVSDSDVIGGDKGMSHHAISGPFFMYAYMSPIDGTSPPSFMLTYYLLADPRMQIADLGFGLNGSNTATLGTDDNGNTFKFMSRSGSMNAHAAANGIRGGFQVIWPDKPGKIITSLRATALFTTQVPDAVLDVAGIETQPNWEAQVAGVTLRMPQFETTTQPNQSRINFQFQVIPPDKASLASFYLSNDRGQLTWSANAGTGTNGLLTGNAPFPRPPYSLHVTLAKRVHELPATFEIKNLPLPTH